MLCDLVHETPLSDLDSVDTVSSVDFDWTAARGAHAGDDFVAQLAHRMRAQPAISYALEGTRPGMYIEYPTPPEPSGYTHAWIGYWSDDVAHSAAGPILTIAASPLTELENLQDRLGLGRREDWALTAESLTFTGHHGEQKVPISYVRDDRHAAIGIDGSDVFIAVSQSRSFTLAGQRITIVTDREPFIQRWVDAVGQNGPSYVSV